jgi:hypothetical protein
VDEPRKQPEGASRQAVGVLIGALGGALFAARMIFNDFSTAGQVPWASALGIVLVGCVVGLLLATLLGGEERPAEEQPAPSIPPDVEEAARSHVPPPHSDPEHVKPAEEVEGLRQPEGPEERR